MMNKYLFGPIDQDNDPHWIIKDFFNEAYARNRFLWVLPLILKKDGCGVDYFYCIFPDFMDADPGEHFEGVIFSIFGEEILVSECVAFDYVRQACDKYVQLHPEAKQEVEMLWDILFIE